MVSWVARQPDGTVKHTHGTYFGTYVIDEKQHAVVHRIKAITNPNYYGAGLVRYYELSGDRLVLSLDKDKMNSLIWARIKD